MLVAKCWEETLAASNHGRHGQWPVDVDSISHPKVTSRSAPILEVSAGANMGMAKRNTAHSTARRDRANE